MMKPSGHKWGFTGSLAEKSAVFAFAGAFALAIIHPFFAVVPLALFLTTCVLAPFLTRFGFYLPIISSVANKNNQVALTFDDGPDPDSTPSILDLLEKYNAHATFFVTGARAKAHPGLVRAIMDKGHAIGNHSYSHDYFIMLRGEKRLEKEIAITQDILKSFGALPKVFRPPMGITNPGLGPVLERLGMATVNFSCRGFDAGNRRIQHLSEKILRRIQSGGIIMMHDLSPKRRLDQHLWPGEVEKVLKGLKEKGLVVVPLADLIQMPVMEKIER